MPQDRNRANFNISMDKEVQKRIHRRIGYEGVRSHYIERGARMALTIDEKADAHGEDLPDGWWDEGLDRYLEWRRDHPEERESARSEREQDAEPQGAD